jgi:hypothetical protein
MQFLHPPVANLGSPPIDQDPDHPGMSATLRDYAPRWSPNGQQIAYGRNINSVNQNAFEIYKVNADGTGNTRLTTGGYEDDPSWSPDGTKIAYDKVDPSTSGSQIYIMDANGNNQHLLPGSDSGYNDATPVWAPDGNRIYFNSSQGGVYYYDYNSSTSTWTRSQSPVTSADLWAGIDYYNGDVARFDVSADGNTLVFASASPDSSGCHQVYTVSTGGGTLTPQTSTLTTAGCQGWNAGPMFVDNAWPPSYCNSSTICIEAPGASDAPYTRKVTIGLSSTGIKRYEYCWSTTGTGTAPDSSCSSHAQTTNDIVSKQGTVNYLGVYSGSGTTWDDGTQPNSDYYLWVRSINTDGSANNWNGGGSNKPLFVHTPRRPVWVGVGDSYSSGHHQDADEPWCPDQAETGFPETYINCPAGGLARTPNDLSFTWITKSVNNLNSLLHAPSSWTFAEDLQAVSGASTFAFGVAGTTPGTDDWATGTAQSASIRADLYARYDSWNVVSMTGGADNTNWGEKLSDFYKDHFAEVSPLAPWAVSSGNPSTDCPDSQSVWDWLHATQLDGNTDDQHIQANLQGIVTVATRYSPGVRVLNVGYPYVVDHTNSCSANSGSWHGAKSVIDDLNADHTAVTGANVSYIDLTSASGFGQDPVSSGYLQLTRLYGYPHANSPGQSRIADMALPLLTSGTTNAVNPSADTYVDSGHASTNYGTTDPLWATSSGTRAFLRFNTSGSVPSGNIITGATLKIYVTNNAVTSGGFEVHPESDTWTESSTNSSNQPTWDSTVFATSSTPTSGSWLTIKLPANAVNTTGNTSLGMRYTASGSFAQFGSRESSTHKPQLTINYAPQLTASADTYVDFNHTSSNHGTANPLWATSSDTRSFLRFGTNGALPSGATLTGATLKIYVTNDTVASGGFEVHPETDTWSESSTNWGNQPTWDSTVLATSSTPTSGSWITISLPTSAINLSGNTSLGLRYTVSGSYAQLASSEDVTQAPQLVLTWQ